MPHDVWQTCFFVPGLTRSECASWVQAWGSIGAVLVAIWVANRRAVQQRSDRLQQNADRLEELFSPAITLAKEAHAELQELAAVRRQPVVTPTGERFRRAGRIEERARDRTRRILLEVKRLDPLVMPSRESILAARQVINAVQDAEQELELIPKGGPVRNMEEGMAEERFSSALQRIVDAKAALETELKRLSKSE